MRTFTLRVVTAAIFIFALLLTRAALQAQSISMSYVTVGNPNNAADSYTGSLYGSVSYTYNIGKYDVTDSQYCTFLNAVDPTGANSLDLYTPGGITGVLGAEDGIAFNANGANGSMYSVIPGYANMPVVDVSFWDTLRFANYLDNGNTESGAYTLIGGNSDGYGTPSNAATVTRNAGATVWLPTLNEWYKAGFYDPLLNGTGGYYTYATQSNTAPGNVVGSGSNEANYYKGALGSGTYSVTQSSTYLSGTNYLTPVGSFTNSKSYYGTYDQSGDVWQWIDATVTLGNMQYRVSRGGDWTADFNTVESDVECDESDPLIGSYDGGFRVASVPEPTSIMLMLAGVAGVMLMLGKARKV